MRRSNPYLIRPQRVGQISLTELLGVSDANDPARTPLRYLRKAENVRFERACLTVRSGIDGFSGFISPIPILGLTSYRPKNGSRYLVGYAGRTDILVDDSEETRGALYVHAFDGLLPHEITPENALLESALTLPTQRRVNWSQFNDHLYFVDGRNGLVRWDGDLAQKASVVTKVEKPADFSTNPSDYPSVVRTTYQATTNAGDWIETGTGEWDAAPESAPSHVHSTYGSPRILGNYGITLTPTNTTGAAVGKLIYYDRTLAPSPGNTVINPDAEGIGESDHILLGAKVNPAASTDNPFGKGSFTPVRFKIGSGNPAGTVDETNSFYWDLTFTTAGSLHLFELSLADVPDAIRTAIRWFGWECRDVNGAAAGDVFYSMDVSEVFFPGSISGGKHYYKAQLKDASTGLVSEGSAAYGVTFVQYATGATDDPAASTAFPNQKAIVRVLFPASAAPEDTITIYRTATDPNLTDPDGGSYYAVKTILRSDADSNGHYLLYDSTSENDLVVSDAMPRGDDVLGTGDDAPHLLVGIGTRNIAAKSTNHPDRLWVSNPGSGESFPDIERGDVFPDDAGKMGAWVDLAFNDGDEIMRLVWRGHRVLVFRRRSIYLFEILNEGTTSEYWNLVKLCDTGLLAPDGLAELPGGVAYYGPGGFYYLADGTTAPTEVPITQEVRETIRAIPADMVESIFAVYHPVDDYFLAGIAERDGQHNTALLMMDRLMRSQRTPVGGWGGLWAVRNPGELLGDVWKPKGALWDGDNLFFWRQDIAAIDTILVPGVDVVPYADFTFPIESQIETGWMELMPGHKSRVTERWLEWTFDEEEPQVGLSWVAASLSLDSRTPGHTESYDYRFESDPYDAPSGLFLTGKTTQADRDVSPLVEGRQHRFRLLSKCSGYAPTRLLNLSFNFVDLGVWRG